MEEEEQLFLTKEFDAVQKGWDKLTGGVSSAIQSGVQTADDFIDENIPGGEQFTARWRQGAVRVLGGTARFVQQELEAADRQVDEPIDHIGDLPYFAVGAFNRGKQQYTENARRMAESAGIDPRAGNVLGEVASEIATFGAGKLASTATKVIPPGTGGMAQQLAAVSNVPTPTKLVPQVTKGGVVMKAITATDEEILSVTGRKTGETITSPAQQKVLTKRRSEVQKYENKLVTLRQELAEAVEFDDPPKVLDDIRDKIGDAEEMLSRRQSNVLIPDSDDPLWYKSSKSKAAKKLEQTRRKMIGTYLEEHHIFPKGMSASFFNRMDELIAAGVAEADDLLLMAEYAAKSGVKAGDVKSNLVNLMKEPHNELHQILRAQGDEIGKQQWAKILSKVDTVDDVLVLWKDVIGKNVKPNAETARIWQPLNDLVEEVKKGG